eukprot:TRINITY_DN31602_c0_g1_i1.p1 TRINITY_DN31602_c0_g1~~TRINITY_DN31602_c0_g1_i1.p1  ORF type:complete len:1123 (+),score=214.48 TRINITY_DN31602_c0_g1_i1:94-3462(+)
MIQESFSSKRSAEASSFEADLASARKHRQSASCCDEDGRVWPLWATDAESLGVYGTGIELYFRFTVWAFGLLAVATVLVLPVLVFSSMGEALEPSDGRSASTSFLLGFLAKTTVANMGSSASGSLDVIKIMGRGVDLRSVTLAAGVLDALMALILLLGMLWFEHCCIPRVVKAHDRTRVSPEAFTVAVTNLPRRLTENHSSYAVRLRAHFDGLLRARVSEENAVPGMLVTTVSDACSPDTPRAGHCMQSLFARGHDAEGRRLGRVLRVARQSCTVQWFAVPGTPSEVSTCSIGCEGKLLDARLLRRLERFGCSPGSSDAEAVVQSVSLVRDFGGLLGSSCKEASEQTTLREIREADLEAGDVKAGLFSSRFSSDPDVLNTKARIGNLADRDVLAAFVTFTRVRHRDFILHSEYRCSGSMLQRWMQARRLRFADSALTLQEAPAPSDIFWENLDFPESKRTVRRRLVLVGCCSLAVVCFALFSLAKRVTLAVQDDSSASCISGGAKNSTDVFCACSRAGYQQVLSDTPSGMYAMCRDWLAHSIKVGVVTATSSVVVVAVNVATTPLAVWIADLERPESLTTRSHRVMGIVFLVQLINLGFVTVLVHWKLEPDFLGLIGNGSFPRMDAKWFLVVGSSQVLTMILNTFCPLLGVFSAWLQSAWRWCGVKCLRCRSQRSQVQVQAKLLDLHSPEQFELAVQHAQQLSAITVTLLFSAGMPLLIPLLMVCLVFFYWSDKYVLLRASCVPPQYKRDLVLWVVRLMPLVLTLHSAVAIWTFGSKEIVPSYIVSGWLGDLHRKLKGEASSLFVADAIDHLFAASALPNVLVGSISGMIAALRILQFMLSYAVGYTLGNDLAFCSRLCRPQPPPTSYALSRPFSEAPLEEMKQLKIAYSYDIADVPRFKFLAKGEELASSGDDIHCDASKSDELLPKSRRDKVSCDCSEQALPSLYGKHGEDCEYKELHPIALKYAPELLDTLLQSNGFGALQEFIRLHCPRFRSFQPDSEHDVIMTTVHRQFCETLDNLLSEHLAELGLDAASFHEILLQRQSRMSNDATVLKLAKAADDYSDFRFFGQLMRDKFFELYAEQDKSLTLKPPEVAAEERGSMNGIGEKGGASLADIPIDLE